MYLLTFGLRATPKFGVYQKRVHNPIYPPRYGYLTPFIFVTCYMVCTFVWLIIWLPNCDSILVDEPVR